MDPMGGIVMTNDGNAILREIDANHPTAKSEKKIKRNNKIFNYFMFPLY